MTPVKNQHVTAAIAECAGAKHFVVIFFAASLAFRR
jgi:hypothetical protein